MTDETKWCTGALPGDAPAHQQETDLKALAMRVLTKTPRGAGGAPGASGAPGAAERMTERLHRLARTLGIPRAVVDALPPDELDATAAQAAMCEGYMDGHGDPLAQALLVFYLKALARRLNA